MRPITDQHNVSRAKLAYLIDATAAPICIIAPISSWAAAVSGFYFSHPQSKYFNVGRIGRDQLEDSARRRNEAVSELERWLAPNLD